MRPRSPAPTRLAGLVAAITAASPMLTPALSTITRTPSSIEMMLPASVPLSRRAAPSRIFVVIDPRAGPAFFSEGEAFVSATLSDKDHPVFAASAAGDTQHRGMHVDTVGDDRGECG